MAIEVRGFDEADYPAIVRVFNACEPDAPWDEAAARDRDATWDYSTYVRLRYVAEVDGEVAGYGQISHHVYAFHLQKFTIHVMVEPRCRRRGIGSALYERLLGELRARDALLARCDVSEGHTETLEFVVERGFAEVARYWESRLDVARFDVAPFARAGERVEKHGIVVRTVADERASDPGCARRIYELHAVCAEDEPSLDPPTMPDFETWRVGNVDSTFFLPELSVVAVDRSQGGRYAGMSLLYQSAASDTLKQSFTGVRREHRGRGVAMAMKVAGIGYARSHGYREIRTENDSLNVPMLRINEALGFRKQPASITFEKRLDGPRGVPPGTGS